MRLLALMLLGVLIAGCARPGVVRSRDQLVIVQTQDFTSLDPIFVSGVGGQELAALMYSYLVKFNDRGELVPDAASVVPTQANGGISADGRTIVYHLRPGVRFSDGNELTSFDVAETIARVAFPGSDVPSRVAYDDVAAIATPDERTIKVFLRTPYAPIVLYLCGPGNAIPILPARLLRGHARLHTTQLDSMPLGSGPYELAHWTRGERLELRANPYYFGGTPKIARITILPVPSSNTAFTMLRSGEADAYVNADDSQYALLAALPGKRTEAVPIDGTGALIFDTAHPALSDPRVRRALTLALNVRAVVNKTLLGHSRWRNPGRGLFEWAYDPRAYAMPGYDPAQAVRLLEKAGWRLGAGGVRRKDGMALDLDVIFRADKPSALEMATQMQAEERAIGVRLSLRRFAVSALVAPGGPLYGGHYDLALFPFIAGFDPDVRDQFSCRRVPPHGFNKSRYCNPALDSIMQEAVLPYERSQRIPYYRRIQRVLARDLPMVAMYQAVSINTFPAWLRGEHSAVNTPFWNVGRWRYEAARN
ncbi:MAG TPA: peptide ABC transporter substrate-binding protein [Candidatus Baltobacteraceae bacterium]|nr:peptide ABC transporter substrate-binding protein [Candidatus Baltobacteraceae bacterium]